MPATSRSPPPRSRPDYPAPLSLSLLPSRSHARWTLDTATEEGYSLGKITAVFHKEPQFPPGHVVPYQVRLTEGSLAGSSVYAPCDEDDFVRLPATGEGVEQAAEAISSLEVN